MSFIDNYEHEYVGHFGHLPIYHPTEVIDGPDFQADPSNLVLGGGSGEHPALVIHHLEQLAFAFLCDQLPEGTVKKFQAVLRENRIVQPEIESCLRFHDWHVAAYVELAKFVAKKTNASDDISGFDTEEWLLLALGEFVWFSLPDLIEGPQRERLLELGNASTHPIINKFDGVHLLPPGYPLSYGKIRQGETTKYGHSRWDLYSPATADEKR
ncbi:MAG: hypothetical protein AAF750_05980 [Planctomycetota bacterium]